MRENLGSRDVIFDGGDDRQGAATLRTLFNTDIEHRLSNWAQRRRAGAEGGGVSPWPEKANVLAGDASIMRKIRAVLVREVAKTKERKPEGEKPTGAKGRGTIKPARPGKKIQKEQEKPADDVEQKAGEIL